MNRIILLWCIIALFSCENKKPPKKTQPMVGIPSKLEKLLSLPQDSVLDYYDLSDDFIMEFPDLSTYTIKSLNLSHNYLDTLIIAFWPKELESLNLSYNYLRKIPNSNRHLKEMNLSNNYIEIFRVDMTTDRLNISYNKLHMIFLYWNYYYYYYNRKLQKKMNYLNISNNPNLSNKVYFVPSMIDTIIRDNIANDKELEMIDWMLRTMKGLREAED